MPRKHRDIISALTSKGFEEDRKRHHVYLTYVNTQGLITSHFTKLSQANPGHDVSDNLLSQMTKQIGLKRRQEIERLIDCPMNQAEYEEAVKD